MSRGEKHGRGLRAEGRVRYESWYWALGVGRWVLGFREICSSVEICDSDNGLKTKGSGKSKSESRTGPT